MFEICHYCKKPIETEEELFVVKTENDKGELHGTNWHEFCWERYKENGE